MNAAAKVIHQRNVFNGSLTDLHVSRQFCFHISLLLSVLISALVVVYLTNIQRVTVSQLQVEEQWAHQLTTERGQLLLEQATLATPARVEQLAAEKLHMVLPANKQAFILRLQ